MTEEQILTILIVFALLLNVLGFVFFVLSLKGEKEKVLLPTKYEKDYDLPMNDAYQEEEDTSYRFKSIEDEYEERYKQTYQPVVEEKDDPFRYEPNTPLKPEKEIESIQEKIYTPEPIEATEEEHSPYQYQPTESYQPVYEEKGTEQEQNPNRFHYEPQYMTEADLDTSASFQEKEIEEEPIRPAPFQLDLTKTVDYKDEIRPTDEDEFEHQPKFEGDYQFKHAYSKEERYKYEYDDYKGFEPTTEEEEEEFDYNIDIDKEHEKYYGAEEQTAGQNRYELYLQKAENDNTGKDDLLAKARKNRHTNEPSGRQMFTSVDLEHVPETPLDRKEREAEETIDIKQYEPKKYENQEMFTSVEQKAPDELDDAEVDRRIEYLMGKMHDPFQGKKRKDPLDEEF